MQFIGNRTFTRIHGTRGHYLTTETFDIQPADAALNVLAGKPATKIFKKNEAGEDIEIIKKPAVEDIAINLKATRFQAAVMDRMVRAAEYADNIGTRTGEDGTTYYALIGRNDQGDAVYTGHVAPMPGGLGVRKWTDDDTVEVMIDDMPPIQVVRGGQLVCFVEKTLVAEPIYHREKEYAEPAAYAVMDPQQQVVSWKPKSAHKARLVETFPNRHFTEEIQGTTRRFDGVYEIPVGNEEEHYIDKFPPRSPSEVAEAAKNWICKNKCATIAIGLIVTTLAGIVGGSIVRYAPAHENPDAPSSPEINTPGFIAEVSSFDSRCLNMSATDQFNENLLSSIFNFARDIGIKYPKLWQHAPAGFSTEFSCPNVTDAISNLTSTDWKNLASTLHAAFEDQFADLLQNLPPAVASAALANSPLVLMCLAGLVVAGAAPEMWALAITAMAFRDHPMVGMLALAVLHLLSEFM